MRVRADGIAWLLRHVGGALYVGGGEADGCVCSRDTN